MYGKLLQITNTVCQFNSTLLLYKVATGQKVICHPFQTYLWYSPPASGMDRLVFTVFDPALEPVTL